ncbi:MAG TPA: hypothetical protein VGG48_09710 [Rhizomicrobium sp.]
MIAGDPDIAAANRRAKELARLEEVTPEWMDEMATRVFNEIKRQIRQIENSKADDASKHAANARTLATLQHTLGEALRMKRDRDARKETKSAKKDANPKRKLAGKLARLSAAQADAAAGGEPR